MDPLIKQLVERARNNDPRLRHISLRSLPLLHVSHEECFAVVESLRYNTHVNTFDTSLHYVDNDQDGQANEIVDASPKQLPPPFESIFSRNTSLTDVRISSSCCSILGSVFRGLAYNSSVQILQVGEMSATGETVAMDVSCAFGLKAMLERNTTIHRLALQGFRWDNEQALRWVCTGLRQANKSLRILELLQIVASTTDNNNTANQEDTEVTATTATTANMNTSIPFDEETTYRSKLDKAEATASTNLMAAIADMVHLKRLCIISCELSGISFASVSPSHNEELEVVATAGLKVDTTISHDSNEIQPRLEELRLVECELTGPSVHTLQQACANNPFLSILDVRSNQLEDESCHALADILTTATSLTKVILEDNNIGDDGLVTLCKNGLASTALKQLCFKGNSFGPKGVQTLAQALQTNPYLEELDLSDNFVGDDGAEALGFMLQSNTALRDLVLENVMLQGRGVVGLCCGLHFNRTLEKLNLSGNSLGATGIEGLSTLLRMQDTAGSCSKLVSMRLSSCHLGDKGVSALAKSLENNTVLEEIILPFNRFGDEGAKAIGLSLPKWKGLTSLQIQFNLFSEAGFERIVQGLAQNFYLKSMYLLNAGPSNPRIVDLFEEMQHWIRLNRAGRRALNENVMSSSWPLVLARASRAYGSDGIFFLLRERPDMGKSKAIESGT